MMSSRRYQYTFLMSSLPRFNKIWEKNSSLISKPRLNQRLNSLTKSDRCLVNNACDVFSFLLFDKPLSSTFFHQKEYGSNNPYGLLPSVESDVLNYLSQFRFFALFFTYKTYDKEFLAPKWVNKAFAMNVRNRWDIDKSIFKLRYAYLQSMEQLIEGNQFAELKKLEMQSVWKLLYNKLNETEFDIHSVTVYVMQWLMVNHKLTASEKAIFDMFEHSAQRAIHRYQTQKD